MSRPPEAPTQRFGGRLTVVRLSHRRSATVTDVLDSALGGPGFQNLLVLCPDETLFFGEGRGIETLRNHFPGGWYGGELPRRGYWGIERSVPEIPLMETLEALLTTKPATAIAAKAFHHTLIWPLLMRGPSEARPGSGQSISGHVAALTKAGWEESAKPDEIPPIEDYSYGEMVYFHPFVRDFLFGDGKTIVKDRALRRFKRKGADVTGVRIAIELGDSPIDFRVERCEILLLRPQVLILLVELSNRKCDLKTTEDPRIGDERLPLTLEQALYLQSRLRHIYPPYFRIEDGTHGDVPASVHWIGLKTGYEMTDPVPDSGGTNPGTDAGRPSTDRLTLTSPRDAFARFVAKGSEPPMYAHWRVFFGDEIKPFETASNRDDGGLYLQQLIDDRIPTMSFIGVDNPLEIHQDDLDRFPAFDAPGLDYEPEFRGRRRDDFQYTRFRHKGTTYYCNGTSFAILCGGDFTDHLLTHFRRHYTHFGVIAHFQHAALLYFADELAETGKELAAQTGDDDFSNPAWAQRIRTLQRRFLKFRTRSYFTEVSNQVQGKDLFRLWYDRLGTQALFDRVSATNSEVYAALENHEMKELAKAQTKLSMIATWLLPISISLSLISACLPIFFETPVFRQGKAGHPNFFLMIATCLMLPAIWVCYLSKEPKNPPPEPNT